MGRCDPNTPTAEVARLEGTALVLEDALIVAYDAAAMLSEMGISKVEICGTLAEALALLEDGLIPSVALLDIDLGGETSLEAALVLSKLQVPIVYSTGYDAVEGAIADFPSGIMLNKPYTAEDMSRALARMGLFEGAF